MASHSSGFIILLTELIGVGCCFFLAKRRHFLHQKTKLPFGHVEKFFVSRMISRFKVDYEVVENLPAKRSSP